MQWLLVAAASCVALYDPLHGEELVLRLDVVEADFGSVPRSGDRPASMRHHVLETLVRPDLPFQVKSVVDGRTVEIRGCVTEDGTDWSLDASVKLRVHGDAPDASSDRVRGFDSKTRVAIRLGEPMLFAGAQVSSRDHWTEPQWFLFQRLKERTLNKSESVVVTLDFSPTAEELKDEGQRRVERFCEEHIRWKPGGALEDQPAAPGEGQRAGSPR